MWLWATLVGTHIEILGQGEVYRAVTRASGVVLQIVGAVAAPVATPGVVDDVLIGRVRQMQQDDADGYEEHSDHKERGQDCAGGEHGLPGGQALLLEGRIWRGKEEGAESRRSATR